MKRWVWSPLISTTLLVAASCGSDDNRSGSGFPGGAGAGGNVAGGSIAGLGAGGSPAGGRPSGTGEGTCEVQTVGTGRLAPNILIVLDRSLSMKPDDGSVNRWDPSVAAVKSITSQLQSRVAFGLMTFSGQGGGGGGNLSCSPGRVNVNIDENTAGAIASALDGIRPAGATPTAVSLEAADDYLQSYQGGPDDRPAPTYVLLITDGAPNCTGGVPPMGNASATGSQEPAQVDATVAAIEGMAARGFKTFVLGYDTQNDATLRDALDRMARAGGTGDSKHRPVGDESSLVATFQEITGNVLSCDFVLDEPVADKSYVKVLFDGRQLNVDDANGWALSGDGQTVSLQGRSCASAKQEGHTISVSVQCVPVGPLF
jgi:hypothetical protein